MPLPIIYWPELQDLIKQSYRVGFIDESIFAAVSQEVERHDPDGIVLWLFHRANGNFSRFIKLLKEPVWRSLSPKGLVEDRGMSLSVPNVLGGQLSHSLSKDKVRGNASSSSSADVKSQLFFEAVGYQDGHEVGSGVTGEGV